jgi:multidrug efflux pump subunit AcrB
LGRAFGLAIIGIFMILVLTFKSLVQPFIVLLTVPLGIVSVIWAFVLHGLPISFMGLLGVIALAGVIVNNAIVFMDFVNQARKNGAAKMQSILDAAKARVRPIFLTSITTVVGILPAAYGIGGIDMFVVPIAMALGWGLMFITAAAFTPLLLGQPPLLSLLCVMVPQL